MSYIKIFRLKTGEDIVSFFEEDKNSHNVKLRYPVSVYIQYNEGERFDEVSLTDWLPKGIMENNAAILNRKDILCVLEPNQQFKEYYLNFLNNFQSIEENEEKQDEVKSLLEILDAKVDNKLH
jgi:hypothetical protein